LICDSSYKLRADDSLTIRFDAMHKSKAASRYGFMFEVETSASCLEAADQVGHGEGHQPDSTGNLRGLVASMQVLVFRAFSASRQRRITGKCYWRKQPRLLLRRPRFCC
jgi:hypothetical protein